MFLEQNIARNCNVAMLGMDWQLHNWCIQWCNVWFVSLEKAQQFASWTNCELAPAPALELLWWKIANRGNNIEATSQQRPWECSDVITTVVQVQTLGKRAIETGKGGAKK